MSAFFVYDGDVTLKKGTDINTALDGLRCEMNWLETFDENVTYNDDGTILCQFSSCGDAGYGFADDVINALKKAGQYIISSEIDMACDEDHVRFTWIPEKADYESVAGQICYSADDAEIHFPRKVPYKELLSMFQDYVYNDVAAAELDYVRDALAAVGVDRHNAEDLGLGYIFDGEEDE